MAKTLKTSYSIHHQVESFFTGNQIEFDQKGEHFYCAYGSNINKVCVEDGQVKAQITSSNQDDIVVALTLSPDSQLLVASYRSGLVMKFDLTDDSIIREFKSTHPAPVSLLKINPSGTLLATGSPATIKLWNIKNHYCSHNFKGVNGDISCLEFFESQDEALLFCSGGDDCIHIFDIESSKKICKLSTHCSTITDIKLSRDGTKLISVGRDKIAVIWNLSREEGKFSGNVIRTIPLFESVESVVLLEAQCLSSLLKSAVDEERLFFATIGEEGLIKYWDAQTGSKIFTQNEAPLSNDRNPNVPCLGLYQRPEMSHLCAVTAERDIYIYDMPELRLIQQLQGHIDEILSACWFANNTHLAIACNSADVKVMELSTSKSQHLKGHNDMVLCVKAVPTDPFCIVTSSKDCTILIWKFDSQSMVGTIVYKATGHTHAIHSMAVLNEERVFISGGEDTTLKRWSFEASRKKEVENSNDSDTIVSVIASHTIKAHEDRIDDIAVSPNDQLVATGSRDKTAKIFSTAGLQILATLKGHRRGIYSVKFSPTDQVVITAGDSTIRMWNLQDFTCVKTFQGHDCAVLNSTFLSSGLQILSMGSDGNMKLWDCKTNECTKTIDAHSGNTWVLSMTQDDDMIVTGGRDEKLVVWKDSTSEEREEILTNLKNQLLQEQDFQNYINRKKWRKALKLALTMESQPKTLNVIREILFEPDGEQELESLLKNLSMDKLNFIVECCVSWNASAKNSSIAQHIFNLIIRQLDSERLLKMPSFTSSLEQLRILTEKSFNRYERLVQQSTFVDFFANCFRIQ